MGLLNNFLISGSGMSAQSLRLNTTASNMANAETVSASEEAAYKARQPVFRNVLLGHQHPAQSGVQVSGIVESEAKVRLQYNPQHPLANEKGYVYTTNVNTVEEMINMMSASRSYQNNVEVLNTSKDLLLRTLSLGR